MYTKKKALAACKAILDRYKLILQGLESGEYTEELNSAVEKLCVTEHCPLCQVYKIQAVSSNPCKGCPVGQSRDGSFFNGCTEYRSLCELSSSRRLVLYSFGKYGNISSVEKQSLVTGLKERIAFWEKVMPIIKKWPAARFSPKWAVDQFEEIPTIW